MFLEKLDLIKNLNAIVYHAKINNQLCNIQEIIANVEYGFSQLKCSNHGWSESKVVKILKIDNDSSTKFYCINHLKEADSSSEGYHDVDIELKNIKQALNSLEKLLIVLQDQMEYLKSEDSNKDTKAYNRIKDQLDDEYSNLINSLNSITTKSKQIVVKGTKTSKISNYDNLCNIKSESENWISNILRIFQIIFEVNLKSEIESKLQSLLGWSRENREFEEETKFSSDFSSPNEIYGKDFELCKIPTQHLQKIK